MGGSGELGHAVSGPLSRAAACSSCTKGCFENWKSGCRCKSKKPSPEFDDYGTFHEACTKRGNCNYRYLRMVLIGRRWGVYSIDLVLERAIEREDISERNNLTSYEYSASKCLESSSDMTSKCVSVEVCPIYALMKNDNVVGGMLLCPTLGREL